MERVQTTVGRDKTLRRQKITTVFQWIFNGLCGFILGGGTFMGQALPLGVCMISVQPAGGQALSATVGAIAGYFLRCEPAEAVEYTAISMLMLFTLFLFQGTELPTYKWFMPLCCSAVCAIMGAVRLLGSTEVTVLLWLSRSLLGGMGTAVFRKAIKEKGIHRTLFMGAIVLSLAGRGKYIDVGLFLGTAAALAGGGTFAAGIMGMALDLGGDGIIYMTFAMLLPAVVCRAMTVQRTWIKGILYSLLPWGTMMLMGQRGIAPSLGIVTGACVGLVLSRFTDLSRPHRDTRDKEINNKHEQVAAVLDALRQELPAMPPTKEREIAVFYDGVGERVCRYCPRYHHCWEREARKTCEELAATAPEILKQGIAGEEDFSKAFRDQCSEFPRFLEAVNRELEGMLRRRKYAWDLRENRRIMEREYSLLVQYLRQESKPLCSDEEKRYTPIVSVCGARKTRERVCGDRSLSFFAPDGSYYIILCDGMGTGEEASCLSSYALRLLEKLVKNGMTPEIAMALLNGNMILRGTGTFSTVDMVRLDLHNGIADVYKWGAAPSFWREEEKVYKIGTPTPPPGVGLGDRQLPEVFHLSMKNRQRLILISDGVYCEDTEGVVEAYRDSTPGTLAAALVSGMEGEDDATAIVVELQPC